MDMLLRNFQPIVVSIFYLEKHQFNVTWNEHKKLCVAITDSLVLKKRFNSKCMEYTDGEGPILKKLRSVEYPFTNMTSRSTLNLSCSTCQHPIYE